MKMEQTEYSETSAYKIQKLGNYPKESIQQRKHTSILHIKKSSLSLSVIQITNYWNY